VRSAEGKEKLRPALSRKAISTRPWRHRYRDRRHRSAVSMTSCCSSSRTRMPAPGSRRGPAVAEQTAFRNGTLQGAYLIMAARAAGARLRADVGFSTPRSSMRPSSRVPHAKPRWHAVRRARAAPDGYTFLFATSAALVMNPYTFKKLSYDPIKDFTPVAMVARKQPRRSRQPRSQGPKTVAELIALEKVGTGIAEHGGRRPRAISQA